MSDTLEEVKFILKKYNQEHLLYFYDELTQDEKEKLLNQILTIDFEKILLKHFFHKVCYLKT